MASKRRFIGRRCSKSFFILWVCAIGSIVVSLTQLFLPLRLAIPKQHAAIMEPTAFIDALRKKSSIAKEVNNLIYGTASDITSNKNNQQAAMTLASHPAPIKVMAMVNETANNAREIMNQNPSQEQQKNETHATSSTGSERLYSPNNVADAAALESPQVVAIDDENNQQQQQNQQLDYSPNQEAAAAAAVESPQVVAIDDANQQLQNQQPVYNPNDMAVAAAAVESPQIVAIDDGNNQQLQNQQPDYSPNDVAAAAAVESPQLVAIDDGNNQQLQDQQPDYSPNDVAAAAVVESPQVVAIDDGNNQQLQDQQPDYSPNGVAAAAAVESPQIVAIDEGNNQQLQNQQPDYSPNNIAVAAAAVESPQIVAIDHGNNQQLQDQQPDYSPNDVAAAAAVESPQVVAIDDANQQQQIKQPDYSPNEMDAAAAEAAAVESPQVVAIDEGNNQQLQNQQPVYNPNEMAAAAVESPQVVAIDEGNNQQLQNQQPVYNPNDMAAAAAAVESPQVVAIDDANNQQQQQQPDYSTNDVAAAAAVESPQVVAINDRNQQEQQQQPDYSTNNVADAAALESPQVVAIDDGNNQQLQDQQPDYSPNNVAAAAAVESPQVVAINDGNQQEQQQYHEDIKSPPSPPPPPVCGFQNVTIAQSRPKRFFENGPGKPFLQNIHEQEKILQRSFLTKKINGPDNTASCTRIYVPVHKCGSSTIGRIPNTYRLYPEDFGKYSSGQLYYAQVQQVANEAYELQRMDRNSVTIFSFVRDPVLRFLSGLGQTLINQHDIKNGYNGTIACLRKSRPENFNGANYEVLTLETKKNATIKLLDCMLDLISETNFFQDTHLLPQAYELYYEVYGHDLNVDLMDLDSSLSSVRIQMGGVRSGEDAQVKPSDSSFILPEYMINKNVLDTRLIKKICRIYHVDVMFLGSLFREDYTQLTNTICNDHHYWQD